MMKVNFGSPASERDFIFYHKIGALYSIQYRKCLENGPIDKFNVCVVSELLIYPIC